MTHIHSTCQETRRRQQVEAAERRQREQESRGIKDPERLRRQQQRMEELERRQAEAQGQNTESGLRWQVN
ncbi:small VCP/p97-interacting protein isoform X2 [Anabrus simplex]|uniref:small VCP/p97-interacting protein isoform X2 n=1 Tax=Anabrus simplex TaxID=316456 RepID=UPI0035A30EFC